MDTSRRPASSTRPRLRHDLQPLSRSLHHHRRCRFRYLARYHLHRDFLWLVCQPRNLRPRPRSRHLLPRPRCNLKHRNHTCDTVIPKLLRLSVSVLFPPLARLTPSSVYHRTSDNSTRTVYARMYHANVRFKGGCGYWLWMGLEWKWRACGVGARRKCLEL